MALHESSFSCKNPNAFDPGAGVHNLFQETEEIALSRSYNPEEIVYSSDYEQARSYFGQHSRQGGWRIVSNPNYF